VFELLSDLGRYGPAPPSSGPGKEKHESPTVCCCCCCCRRRLFCMGLRSLVLAPAHGAMCVAFCRAAGPTIESFWCTSCLVASPAPQVVVCPPSHHVVHSTGFLFGVCRPGWRSGWLQAASTERVFCHCGFPPMEVGRMQSKLTGNMVRTAASASRGKHLAYRGVPTTCSCLHIVDLIPLCPRPLSPFDARHTALSFSIKPPPEIRPRSMTDTTTSSPTPRSPSWMVRSRGTHTRRRTVLLEDWFFFSLPCAAVPSCRPTSGGVASSFDLSQPVLFLPYVSPSLSSFSLNSQITTQEKHHRPSPR
jgi:hypothetical protein